MAVDADVEGVPILFAWPSEGKLVGYVADKDAATYSRDALAQLLITLSRDRKPGDVTLLGHSMGAWLTVESVRQLRLTGRGATIARLNVVLASPDIDIDVFRAQMRTIGPLTPPMTVLVSRDDRALAFSGRISGERTRLGALDVDDPRVQEGARAANVRVIDISTVQAPDSFNHDRFVAFASLYSQLGGMGHSNTRNQADAFVFNSVGTILSAPFTLVGSALAGQ
jgi:esterase/lipase superfamily enzyme